ncbi:MAG TPA: alpha/beta fold hydrolase [Burkholderiales bacterium]|nr:alpha/beta fold hydrolase [Burkholderiales bacterium]
MLLSLRDVILPVIGVAVLLVVGGMTWLYFSQERLIFYPQRLDLEAARILQRAYPSAEPVELEVDSRVKVRGWLVHGQTRAPAPLVIYFGGNGEEVSWLVTESARLAPWAVLLINYRGYGLSDGRPSESVLYKDAVAIHDWAAGRPDIDARRIVLVGRSLGTGVATYLAAQRAVSGVVLVSPYDNLVEVARGVYPYLLVDYFMRYRFDSAARAKLIHAPLLALVADQDTIVRPERSRSLVRAWGGPAHLELLVGVGHNDIQLHPHYWPLIAAFLAERAVAQQLAAAQ